MLICKLQHLTAEVAAEIAGLCASDLDYDRALGHLRNGTECAVLRCEVAYEGDQPWQGCYDIAFSDGLVLPAICGYHLRGIQDWKD